MAEKEEEKVPAFINYDEEETFEPVEKWKHTDFKAFWKRTYAVKYQAYPRWTMKEQVLLANLMKEFKQQDLADMIYYWILEEDGQDFGQFYQAAHHIYKQTRGYTWD